MTPHRHHLFTTLGLALLLLACSKSSSVPGADSGQTARLSARTWYFRDAGIDFDRDGTTDNVLPTGTLPACALDNTYTFNGDGSGSANDSTLRCDTLPQKRPFTWAFANNEQSIDLSGAAFFGFSGRFKVHLLNDTALMVARDTVLSLPQFPQPVNGSVIINLNHH
ncbi:hypothetical protein EPD60_09795 [Flaviaesturariibacter flavus]|uniref:Lipocalin-like domain-containing protein n=1 Tax=Flaviaesturariibacter flavus TaxID=2502780 RepID=A0A4R1BBE1_9BACT|nr:hypothetical protein [Flaviaesturariibacter flavus]TCJ14284.1 hypothetical protein EPD60_09795 [Flaviaesturariibacter flavus]